jgi:hypothetical protein
MKRNALVLVTFCAMSCASAGARSSSHKCGLGKVEQGSWNLPKVSTFKEALVKLTLAHCNCSFPEEVRMLIPNPPVAWAEIATDSQRFCFSKFEFISADIGQGELITANVFFKGTLAGSMLQEDLLVLAAQVGDRWSFSWPQGMGPGKLH